MTTYYANSELDGYRAQLANHEAQKDAWQETADQMQAAHAAAMAAYEQSHSDWVEGGSQGQEPKPPPAQQPPPQPAAPAHPSTVYEARTPAAPETIGTATGPALVLPPRIVLEGGGREFSVSQGELDALYTPTSEPLPTS